jgi:hypothetical protein
MTLALGVKHLKSNYVFAILRKVRISRHKEVYRLGARFEKLIGEGLEALPSLISIHMFGI